MKNKTTATFIKIFAAISPFRGLVGVLLILFLPSILHAQPQDPGGDVDNAPIDGGLSLLVAAGVGYGVKKLKARKVTVAKDKN